MGGSSRTGLGAAAFAVAFLSGACAPPLPPNVPSERQTAEVLELGDVAPGRLGYLLFVPVDYDDSGEPWPLIVFLHGDGERGDRIGDVAREGLPWELRGRRYFPFVVVSPQCPRKIDWPLAAVEALVSHLTARLRIDPDRVYATGLSAGGTAALELVARHPSRFAAVAVVAVSRAPAAPCRLVEVPVWIFHNRGDERIPVSRPERLAQTLKACGVAARLTVYPESGHDSWSITYARRDVYDWFLAHRRAGAAAREARP